MILWKRPRSRTPLFEWLLFLWCRKWCHNHSPFLWIIMTLWIVFFFLFLFCFGYIVNSYAYSYYAVSVEIWTFLVFGIQWNSSHLTLPIHFRWFFFAINIEKNNSAASKVAMYFTKRSCLFYSSEKQINWNEMLMIEKKKKRRKSMMAIDQKRLIEKIKWKYLYAIVLFGFVLEWKWNFIWWCLSVSE